eukprot:6821337-Pyramimonas_sp.AAC.1
MPSNDVHKVPAVLSPSASISVGTSCRREPATSVTTCCCTLDVLALRGTAGPSRASPLRKRISASSCTCTMWTAANVRPTQWASNICDDTCRATTLETMAVYISTQASFTLPIDGLLTVLSRAASVNGYAPREFATWARKFAKRTRRRVGRPNIVISLGPTWLRRRAPPMATEMRGAPPMAPKSQPRNKSATVPSARSRVPQSTRSLETLKII